MTTTTLKEINDCFQGIERKTVRLLPEGGYGTLQALDIGGTDEKLKLNLHHLGDFLDNSKETFAGNIVFVPAVH